MTPMPYRQPQQHRLSKGKDGIVKRHKANEPKPQLERLPVYHPQLKFLPRERQPPQPRNSKQCKHNRLRSQAHHAQRTGPKVFRLGFDNPGLDVEAHEAEGVDDGVDDPDVQRAEDSEVPFVDLVMRAGGDGIDEDRNGRDE